ncbi:MAG TPA: hypothetical protein VFB93_18365 [Burkholderiales bacterium]|nr:hypothetical protein [Burkholderiales bacterium]
MKAEIRLWQWRYTDEFGKRRIFPCRLSEENGKQLKDAERIEGSLEVRRGGDQHTNSFQRFPR